MELGKFLRELDFGVEQEGVVVRIDEEKVREFGKIIKEIEYNR